MKVVIRKLIFSLSAVLSTHLGVAIPAYPEIVGINLIVDSDPSAVSDDQLDTIVGIASLKLAQAGVTLQVRRIERRALKYVHFDWGDIPAAENGLAYSRIIAKNNLDRGPRINFFVLRPIEVSGYRQVIASAYGICMYGRPGFQAMAQEFADPNQLMQSGVVMAHEIAHLLGADHTDENLSLEIMNPFVSTYLNRLISANQTAAADSVSFSTESISEMSRCLKRNQRRRNKRILEP